MRFHELPTPVYVIDEARLKANLERLNALERRTGCRVLLAQKAFSAFALYPLIGRYISGTAASGLYEARLGFEEMGKENHVYSPDIRRRKSTRSVRFAATSFSIRSGNSRPFTRVSRA